MLRPSLGTGVTESEVNLHNKTTRQIVEAAEKLASDFMDGTVRYLLAPNSNNEEAKEKLKAIYREAADLSYRLWTQKTTIICYTMEDQGLRGRTFDADDQYLTPHSLVRCDDVDDQSRLRGRPITLIVHPLLLVYGNDEGKEYDKHRVWAPAEVWLDSK